MCYDILMGRINFLFKENFKRLKDARSKVEHICITADCWSTANKSNLGVTGHWLLPDLSRKSIALVCCRILADTLLMSCRAIERDSEGVQHSKQDHQSGNSLMVKFLQGSLHTVQLGR